jgi:NADH:ubiquinone oxidoreductase subunit E
VSQAGTGSGAHGAEAAPPRVFEGAARKELDAILKKYPTAQSALLPALWIVQERQGWVSPGAMAEVAEVLQLTVAYVKGVVTFYTPCNLCGAEGVVAALLTATGCKRMGETSPDGLWTVVETECLGACGFATPVLIDDDLIESVTAESVPALVARYR